MNLDPILGLWLVFSLLAIVMLARMMDMRRAKLAQMLQVYVEARLVWAKKRARAARLTQQLAHNKAAEEAQADGAMPPADTGRTRPAARGIPSTGLNQSVSEPSTSSKAA